MHGLVASAQKSAYVAAKHGIVGFTKVAALETATTGITFNAICPGWVLTPLVQKQIDDRAARDGISERRGQARSCSAEKQPSLQFTTPEAAGRAGVFLCSPGGRQRARRGLGRGRRLDGAIGRRPGASRDPGTAGPARSQTHTGPRLSPR